MYRYEGFSRSFLREKSPFPLTQDTLDELASSEKPLLLKPRSPDDWLAVDPNDLHLSGIPFWDVLALKPSADSTTLINYYDILDIVGCRTGSGRIIEVTMIPDYNYTQKIPINAQYQMRTFPPSFSKSARPIVIASLPFTSTIEKWKAMRGILVAELKMLASIFNGPESDVDTGNFILQGSAAILRKQLRRIKTAGGTWDRDPSSLQYAYI